MDYNAKQQDIRARMVREQKMLDALMSLKAASPNPEVHRDCDKKARELQRTLEYFENSLAELEGASSAQSPSKALPTPPPHEAQQGSSSRWSKDGSAPDQQQPASPPASGTNSRRQHNYSNLELIKADTPLMAAKISKMVYKLDFKLVLEKQFKDGLDRMARLYGLDGDRRSRADAESKRAESRQKMMLLQNALKKYQNLNVMGDLNEEDAAAAAEAAGDPRGMNRKPLSGALKIDVLQAKDLDRPPVASKFGRPKSRPESTVVIKIEDAPRARTHPSRNDRWNEEIELHVEKANEVEITIYDRPSASDTPTLIGLLWFRISDVVEEMRRKKAGQDSAGNAAWVTANAVKGGHGHSHSGSLNNVPPFSSAEAPVGQQLAQNPPGTVPPLPGQAQVDDIRAWFAVEPEGAIELRLNFAKDHVRKRPMEAAGLLGRQGAVRKRKEETFEQNGHQFVQKQFYTIYLCAYCRDFLLNAAGMQCEDCKYVCHKKCFNNVVTKCISKSSSETDADEEKINHRIPHRFEPISSVTPNWCCHCGAIMNMGRKKARRCQDCDLTAHAECVHLVPDFCGMSMEMANQLLREVKSINVLKQRHPGKLPPGSGALPPSGTDELVTAAGRMSMDNASSHSSQRPSSAQSGRPVLPGAGYGDQQPPAPQQQQQQQAVRPPPPQDAGYQPRPMPPGAAHPGQMQGGRQPYPPQSQPQHPGYPAPPQQMPSAQQQQYTRQQQEHQAQMQAMQQQQALQQQQQQQHQQQQVAARPGGYAPQRAPTKQRVGLDDFNFLAVLGKGNFGKVMLAEEKTTSQLFAIKVLKKDFIIENDEVESTKSEKRVFLAAARERHPFLLNLHSAFQTETRIYFCMEYVPGGDLMLHIQRKQFSRRQATFYAAEVLLALEYFHSNGIVYRDLKLDNIMLTLDGHIKLADYGLCKENMWYGHTTNTFCGTPEFMAPEILLESKYGRAVDWWAFGVLIYEMLLGQSPFRGEDEDEIFDSILEDEPLYPIHMPKDSVAILQALLSREESLRLGSGPDDAASIKRHPFFKDINWDDLLHKRIAPPFYPQLTSATDVSNFDSEFTQEKPYLTPVHSHLSQANQQEFEGFSWIAPWAGT